MLQKDPKQASSTAEQSSRAAPVHATRVCGTGARCGAGRWACSVDGALCCAQLNVCPCMHPCPAAPCSGPPSTRSWPCPGCNPSLSTCRRSCTGPPRAQGRETTAPCWGRCCRQARAALPLLESRPLLPWHTAVGRARASDARRHLLRCEAWKRRLAACDSGMHHPPCSSGHAAAGPRQTVTGAVTSSLHPHSHILQLAPFPPPPSPPFRSCPTTASPSTAWCREHATPQAQVWPSSSAPARSAAHSAYPTCRRQQAAPARPSASCPRPPAALAVLPRDRQRAAAVAEAACRALGLRECCGGAPSWLGR